MFLLFIFIFCLFCFLLSSIDMLVFPFLVSFFPLRLLVSSLFFFSPHLSCLFSISLLFSFLQASLLLSFLRQLFISLFLVFCFALMISCHLTLLLFRHLNSFHSFSLFNSFSVSYLLFYFRILTRIVHQQSARRWEIDISIYVVMILITLYRSIKYVAAMLL